MDIQPLVTSAITILSPYVAAGAKKAAEVVGEAAARQGGQLLERLRGWMMGDDEAATALQNFEKKPDRYKAALENILAEKLSADPVFAGELQMLIETMGPNLDIFQKVQTLSGAATGLDMGQWDDRLGSAKTHQEVDIVEPIGVLTGVRIGKS